MTGLKESVRKLREHLQKRPDQVAAALYQEAQVIMTEAKRRTPVDTGALRASGHVGLPEREGSKLTVPMSFGTEYAIYVHENLEAKHPVGQARFLASAVEDAAPGLSERVATRVKDMK
jgi:hypothetical protein